MRFETIAIHAGADPDPATGSIAPPIHLSTTYEHGPAGERPPGYLYIREGSPTQTRLEQALAAIEGAEASLVFSSGLAAGAAYLQAFPPGTHVIFHEDIYYDFRTIAKEFLPRWGMEASAVDMSEIASLRAAIRPNTRLIWTETPTNPLLIAGGDASSGKSFTRAALFSEARVQPHGAFFRRSAPHREVARGRHEVKTRGQRRQHVGAREVNPPYSSCQAHPRAEGPRRRS